MYPFPLLARGAQLNRLKQLIRLRGHNEIVFVQAADLVSPPIEVLVARFPRNLVYRRPLNLAVDQNHKIRLPLLAGWVLQT